MAMTSLKHKYLIKRTHIMDRLVKHQNDIEEYFGIYYDYLDKRRNEILKDEQMISEKFDVYELKLQTTLKRTASLLPDEFYMESSKIMEEVENLEDDINKFSVYMPSFQLKHGLDFNQAK